ncbi:YbhB/YbcL family Raf kinase inhibitor-like protein [Salinibacterium sp. ZJ450]|uniref:YbhB/YbcL family Raf kinase inhibitor-like protein n=1 Tax=Salinibacterium sp. ZJ450 TaxID=2708338 RepID=UPI0014233A32|nr:YbhB/YbcL family Raf kinase inhibitor-like protein [Salinibacterium sp. ZJ450]
MELSSSAFASAQPIPERHGKRAGNASPSLSWTGVPAGTRSFALSALDRISPGNVYVHWLACDIPGTVTALDDDASGSGRMPEGSRELTRYVGPFPPSGTHTYEFTLYALDTDRLDLAAGVSLPAFERAVNGHTLDAATLSGTFKARG